MGQKSKLLFKNAILQHIKYPIVIKLVEKHNFDRWVFEVIKGESFFIDSTLYPDFVWDMNLDTWYHYSGCTLRKSFRNITNSTAGKLLYGT